MSGNTRQKIAFLYGNPIEGGGIEKNIYTYQQFYDFDILVPESKHNQRQKLKNVISYNKNEVITDSLNEYDIVFIPKLVDKGDLLQHQCFFKSVYETTAKTGLIIHEARYEAFNKIPLAFGYVHICDAVFTFSEDTQLTKEILTFSSKSDCKKEWNKNVFSFTNPFIYDDWKDDWVDFKDRNRVIAYFGRFATYKNPDKLRFLFNKAKELNYDFKFAMHGIDRSIGSKSSIIDLPEVKYHKEFLNEYDGEYIDVFGPYLPQDASKFMGQNLFGYNGYNFSKMRHNYVFRLEYAQMEIMSAGCVPIFHKDLGENTVSHDGVKMIDIPYLAVWYKENENEEEVLKKLEEISNNEDLYNKYIQSGKNFIQKYNDTKQSMEKLLSDMEKVQQTQQRCSLDTYLDEMYYQGFSDEFNALFKEHVPFISTYDMKKKQLRYLDKTIKIYDIKGHGEKSTFETDEW